jgi:excinuclease UvrABC nuclease subunit
MVSMPFPFRSTPRLWVQKNINNLQPGVSGVYGITNNRFDFIYIGQSDDVRERLLQHFNLTSAQALCISKNNPAFFYITNEFYNIDQEEADLISELDPICNRAK